MGPEPLTRLSLASGVVGPTLFVAVFLIDGATRPGYSAWRHWVSHLSLGERGWVNLANLTVSGLLIVGFAVGLRRVLRPGRAALWGPLLVGAVGLGLVLGGIFPIDPGLGYPPGTPPGHSLRGTLHDIGAALFFGSLTAACFVLARRFAGDPRWQGWARYSRITGVLVPASFVACSALVSLDYAGILPGAPSGLLERIAVIGGCGWLALLAHRLAGERPPAASG